ncbi:MAG: sigma-70 family RNA polymerase sigma factor [Pirellulales bacterium]|nr:sigma-70 family RNA polymerase sigma factor [Pirellulales bacterium]
MSGDKDERFLALITQHQRTLYSYILSLVYRAQDAQDVLQETNLVLWRKKEKGLEVQDFRSWACRVAYIQVLAYRKRKVRDRLFFDCELLERLAKQSEELGPTSRYLEALQACLLKLPKHSREMVVMRYDSPGSVACIAQATGRSAAAVSQALYRIRHRLLRCVRSSLALEEE